MSEPRIYYDDGQAVFWHGGARDVLRSLPENSVHVCTTSPPYWNLRDYGVAPSVWGGDNPDCAHEWGGTVALIRTVGGERGYGSSDGAVGRARQPTGTQSAFCIHCNAWRGCLGLEPTVDLFVAHLVEIFREVRRVLRLDGTCWVNLGDSYAGSGGAGGDYNEGGTRAGQPRFKGTGTRDGSLKAKDLCMVPARFALAAQADGWWLRSEISWCKTSAMPESVHGSYFTRHRIKIREYERLLSLRNHAARRAVPSAQTTLQDMPQRSGKELSANGSLSIGAGTLSAKCKRASNDPESRSNRDDEGETADCKPIGSGQSEQDSLRINRKGACNETKGDCQIQILSSGETEAAGMGSTQEIQSCLGREEEGKRSALPDDREGANLQEYHVDSPALALGHIRTNVDVGGLAGNSAQQSLPLLLLQAESQADDGPCDPDQQRRSTYQGKHRTGVRAVQFEEEQSDSSALVDCPGCAKCAEHDGLILVQGAGRPSSATERIYLLAKSPRYFYDNLAVREAPAPSSLQRIAQPGFTQQTGGAKDYRNGTNGNRSMRAALEHWAENPTGAALRNYWLLGPEPSHHQHYAAYPTAIPRRAILAGTSDKGVCPACAAPWRRVVAREKRTHIGDYGGKSASQDTQFSTRRMDQNKRAARAAIGDMGAANPFRPPVTLGWEPSCRCTRLRCPNCAVVHGTAHTNSKEIEHDASERLAQTSGCREGLCRVSGGIQRSSMACREEELLQQSLPCSVVGKDTKDNQGVVENNARIHCALQAKSSISDENRLHLGASLCDGAEIGANVASERGSQPQKRNSRRQPGREPRITDEGSARQIAEAPIGSDLPIVQAPFSSGRQCSRCGSECVSAPYEPVPATVLDIFLGSGTTALVAKQTGRRCIGIDLNATYLDLAVDRCRQLALMPTGGAA